MRRRLLGLAVILLAMPAASARAQKPISLWLGAGRAVTADSIDFSLKNLDAYGALQLDIPLLPVALRADVSFAGGDVQKGTRNVTASAVLPLRLPVLQPYAIAGYGIYDYGKPGEKRGISYGAGVRLQATGLGLFVQARRHRVLGGTIGTVGIIF